MCAFSSWTHAVLQCSLHTRRVTLEILQQLPLHLRKVFLELNMSINNNFRTETPGFFYFNMKFYLLWFPHILVKTIFLVLVFSLVQIPVLAPNYCVIDSADKRIWWVWSSQSFGRSYFCGSVLLASLSCKVISSEAVNKTEMWAICKASELTSIGMNRKVHTSQN